MYNYNTCPSGIGTHEILFLAEAMATVNSKVQWSTFLLLSCQIVAYMKVSMSWPDMAFCFMPGASHHHKDDVGCTGTPF
jgi:hypothetical protein